jgi:hypothetical protein
MLDIRSKTLRLWFVYCLTTYVSLLMSFVYVRVHSIQIFIYLCLLLEIEQVKFCCYENAHYTDGG